METKTTRVAVASIMAVSAAIGLWVLAGGASAPAGIISAPVQIGPPQASATSEVKPIVPLGSSGRAAAVDDIDALSHKVADAKQLGGSAGASDVMDHGTWVSAMARDCGISDADIARIRADTKLLQDIGVVWEDLSKEVGQAIHKRSTAVAGYAKDKQVKGLYEVVPPTGPFPDADKRTGEIITFGYEANPRGGRDLVRVVRIQPGESPSVDAAVGAERLAAENRALVIQQMVRGR